MKTKDFNEIILQVEKNKFSRKFGCEKIRIKQS